MQFVHGSQQTDTKRGFVGGKATATGNIAQTGMKTISGKQDHHIFKTHLELPNHILVHAKNALTFFMSPRYFLDRKLQIKIIIYIFII